MQMKFYSPLTADFFPNEPDYEDEFYDEYEGYPLDGHELLAIRDAIRDAVEKDIADFQRRPDAVLPRGRFRPQQGGYVPSRLWTRCMATSCVGCLTVELKEPLLDDEQTVLCNYISGQYSDGWGEGFEQTRYSRWRTASWLSISGRITILN